MRKFLLLLLLSLGVGYYLFGVNLNASLGMVDDHEIVSFLGADHNKIEIAEIPTENQRLTQLIPIKT